MLRGFLYLAAIMDWHTRKVLAWRISNTPPLGVCLQTPAGQGEADFCVEALNQAIASFGPPEIMNTDQAACTSSLNRCNPNTRASADLPAWPGTQIPCP